jgi:hypothetical protein
MALFPPDSLCILFEEDIPDLDDICFPGGFCLSYIWDAIGKIPTLADMSMDFFSQIGPAMAPLKPLFDILDTVLQIFKCVKAIPKTIVTLNPKELLECFPALVKLINQLLSLLPYVSIPKMIKAILINLSRLLGGIASDLRYLESQLQRIADQIDRASSLGDVKMNGFLVCAQQTMNTTTLSTAEALKGIGRIILLINILLGLFGGPEIPCFGELLSNNLDKPFDYVIDLLATLAEILRDIANAIIIPDLALALALGEQRC